MKTCYSHQITQSACQLRTAYCLCVCVSMWIALPYIHGPKGTIPALQRVLDAWKIHINSSGQVVSDQTPEQEIHGEPLGTVSVWWSTGKDREQRKEEVVGEALTWKAAPPPVTVWFRDEEERWKQQDRVREPQREREIFCKHRRATQSGHQLGVWWSNRGKTATN